MQDEIDTQNPPIFNMPRVIGILIATIIAAHAIRIFLVPDVNSQAFILLFSAIPARYGEFASQIPYTFAAWYTPVSHALVHGDWSHLLINMAWLLAFGAPVAKRLGAVRFIGFAVIGTIGGFLLHLVTHWNEFTPMVGASGGVAALMGGAIRLGRDTSRPILPLISSLQNRGFMAFIAIWFALNLLFGFFPGIIAPEGTQIAWQAHVGGFLTGLLLIKLFDR